MEEPKVEYIKGLDKDKVYVIKLKFAGLVSKEVMQKINDGLTKKFKDQGISPIIIIADYHVSCDVLGSFDINKEKLLELLKK